MRTFLVEQLKQKQRRLHRKTRNRDPKSNPLDNTFFCTSCFLVSLFFSTFLIPFSFFSLFFFFLFSYYFSCFFFNQPVFVSLLFQFLSLLFLFVYVLSPFSKCTDVLYIGACVWVMQCCRAHMWEWELGNMGGWGSLG